MFTPQSSSRYNHALWSFVVVPPLSKLIFRVVGLFCSKEGQISSDLHRHKSNLYPTSIQAADKHYLSWLKAVKQSKVDPTTLDDFYYYYDYCSWIYDYDLFFFSSTASTEWQKQLNASSLAWMKRTWNCDDAFNSLFQRLLVLP